MHRKRLHHVAERRKAWRDCTIGVCGEQPGAFHRGCDCDTAIQRIRGQIALSRQPYAFQSLKESRAPPDLDPDTGPASGGIDAWRVLFQVYRRAEAMAQCGQLLHICRFRIGLPLDPTKLRPRRQYGCQIRPWRQSAARGNHPTALAFAHGDERRLRIRQTQCIQCQPPRHQAQPMLGRVQAACCHRRPGIPPRHLCTMTDSRSGPSFSSSRRAAGEASLREERLRYRMPQASPASAASCSLRSA